LGIVASHCSAERLPSLLQTGSPRRDGTSGAERELLAAIVAVAIAFFATAAIRLDVADNCRRSRGRRHAGLAAASRPDSADAPSTRPLRAGVAVLALVVAWAVLLAQVLPWLTANRIDASQAASAGEAIFHQHAAAALDAKSIDPWAATP